MTYYWNNPVFAFSGKWLLRIFGEVLRRRWWCRRSWPCHPPPPDPSTATGCSPCRSWWVGRPASSPQFPGGASDRPPSAAWPPWWGSRLRPHACSRCISWVASPAHVQLLRCESPQADLCRTHPDQVRRLGVIDPDLQPELSRPGVKDLRVVVELLLGERVKSPLVDRISKEFGVFLGESGSIQADQHHPLTALHRRGVGEPGASGRLLVWGSELRRRRGVPRPLPLVVAVSAHVSNLGADVTMWSAGVPNHVKVNKWLIYTREFLLPPHRGPPFVVKFERAWQRPLGIPKWSTPASGHTRTTPGKVIWKSSRCGRDPGRPWR